MEPIQIYVHILAINNTYYFGMHNEYRVLATEPAAAWQVEVDVPWHQIVLRGIWVLQYIRRRIYENASVIMHTYIR
jgi:hypothetical protein